MDNLIEKRIKIIAVYVDEDGNGVAVDSDEGISAAQLLLAAKALELEAEELLDEEEDD